MGGFMSRGKYRRYECSSHNDHLGVRCRKSVSADTLEARVWEVLEDNLLCEPENLQRYINLKLRDIQQRQDEVSHVQQSLAGVDTELEALAVKQQKLLNLFLDGDIDQAMFSTNKTTLDQTHEQLETVRSELQSRMDVEHLQQSQVETAISAARRQVENLPRASIAERRLVIESLDVHVAYRDMEHVHIFFDLPLTDNPDDQDLPQFRWKGIESLQAIDGYSQPNPIRVLGLTYDRYSDPGYAIHHKLVARRGLRAPPIMSEAQYKDLALPARPRSL
jgi:hypothetical protein